MKKGKEKINTGVVFSEILILIAITLTIINIVISSDYLTSSKQEALVQALQEQNLECKELVEKLNVKVVQECPQIDVNELERIENKIVIINEEKEDKEFEEKPSPADRISIEDISIQKSRFCTQATNIEKLYITNTNSMDPLFDEESTIIVKELSSPYHIQIGDIIAYNENNSIIVHRVINISIENQTTFFQTKGDNNKHPDKNKVSFNKVKGVVIGILY